MATIPKPIGTIPKPKKEAQPSLAPAVEGNEKRKDLRVPLRVLNVRSELQGEVFFGYATNISTSGIFIQTPNPKEPGLRMSLSFVLPQTKQKISCLAEVTWIVDYTTQTGPSPGMGLKFSEISEEAAEAIRVFVETADR